MSEIKNATVKELEEVHTLGESSIEEAKEQYLGLDEKSSLKPMFFSQIQLMTGMSELMAEIIRLRKELDHQVSIST